MPVIPNVAKCANPACTAEFRRLGEGRLLSVFIENPRAWDLPEHSKQKVVWLCEKCSASLNVEIDHHRHSVQLLDARRTRRRRRI